MEYSIRQLSEIAGISARALRYYDKIGLLKPSSVRESGYRFYGEKELEMLQQILFYKERGLKLEQIAKIMQKKDFDVMEALNEHLSELQKQQQRIDCMITAVKNTMLSMKGEIIMTDKEKFAAFKKDLIQKNETLYGKEIRNKYKEEEVEASNKKIMDMTKQQYKRFKELEKEILKALENAAAAGLSPAGEAAKDIVCLHRQWLAMTWKKYTPKAHKGITQMYTADPRFVAYYDKNLPGCAQFLEKAVEYWSDKI